MSFQRLSRRGQDPSGPVEGLPPHLAGPVLTWVRDAFRSGGPLEPSGTALEQAQLQLELKWGLSLETPSIALMELLQRSEADEAFALDVVEYCLYWLEALVGYFHKTGEMVDRLALILLAGGSVWEVSQHAEDDVPRFTLTRRAVGPVQEMIAAVPPSTRSHQHLVAAWMRLSGRDPYPGGAYREAVRAVEAAAKPIVLPNDALATLGKMIRALEDKPEKWTTTLGSVDDVTAMMKSVWTGQLDRHGTDDESVPLNVNQEQADAAVHICLTLTRLFGGGHVTRCGDAPA